MKKDSAFKIALIAVVGLIILWLAKVVLFPTNYVGINIRGNYGGRDMYMYTNYGYGAGTLSLLLVFLIKLLFIVFVVALVVGLFMTAKNYIFSSEDVEAIKGAFSSNKKTKKICNVCGKKLDSEWKVCPHCGKEVESEEE